jgi:uncharacterized protein YndB with AHSA1/START domain
MKTNTNNAPEVAGRQKTISIKRTFDLPLDRVWKAWSEPESCKKWWGPKNFTCPQCKIDFRVGGNYLSCMKGPDGKEYWSTGTYKEIIHKKKIVFTDSFSDEKGNRKPASDFGMPGNWPMELQVTLGFEEVNGKTNMSLTHLGVPDEMYDECIQGWQESFDKLQENLK